MVIWRKLLNLTGGLMIGAVALLLALTAWVQASLPYAQPISVQTARYLLNAPFATGIVIGDSRVAWGEPIGNALFVGYGGANLSQLERVSRVLCAMSDDSVVIALGVNDTRLDFIDVAGSLASLERIVESCGPQRVTLAGIWPTESGVEPLGRTFDPQAAEAITRGMRRIAVRTGADFAPAPPLTHHTFDGVHFTPDVSRRYIAFLARLTS